MKVSRDIEKQILSTPGVQVRGVQTEMLDAAHSRGVGLPLDMSEKDFQAWVVGLAESRGWLVYHPFDSRKSRQGYPDLTMVRLGRILFAELKTESGEPTEDQKLWLGELERHQAVEVYLWRPGDWQTIEKVL